MSDTWCSWIKYIDFVHRFLFDFLLNKNKQTNQTESFSSRLSLVTLPYDVSYEMLEKKKELIMEVLLSCSVGWAD